MATKRRELTNQNSMTGEENESTGMVDFLERGLRERRGGKERKSGKKGMGAFESCCVGRQTKKCH